MAVPAGTRRPTRILLAVCALGVGLALVTSWPLPMRMASTLPDSGPGEAVGDPALVSWQIAWEGYALKTNPLGLLDANIFYPLENTLAFLDPIHGFSPIAIIGSGADAAAIRYNLLFLFAYVLAFIAPYLLARECGSGHLAAVLAGAAFAYSPWRLGQLGHLLVISSGGIPLALFMLLRGYRSGNTRWVLGGWILATWQLSIGFTLGLQFAYLLLVLGAIAFIRWLTLRRPPVPRAVVTATVAGVLIFGGVGLTQALPALRVTEEYPEAVRTEAEVSLYSPRVESFRAAPENNLLWGDVSAQTRATLPAPVEQTLFPGLAIMTLAVFGVGYERSPRRLRYGLLLGIVASGYLAMGFHAPGGQSIYKTLFEMAPGWDAIRTPGRLMTITTLFLALLAAQGFQQMLDGIERFSRRRSALASRLVGWAAIALVVVEGYGPIRLPAVPDVPASQWSAKGPIAHFPMDEGNDRLYMYWSTDGFPRIINGVVAFRPQHQLEATAMVNAFPDRSSVEYLEKLGIRTVIVHLDRMESPSEWQRTALSRASALELENERIGTDIIFRLDGDS